MKQIRTNKIPMITWCHVTWCQIWPCYNGPRCAVCWPLWWRHQMETFSALLAICAGNSPIPGEFPAQRPVTRSFDVFFDLRLNKRLSKQPWGWWFETPSWSLWRQCNACSMSGVPSWRANVTDARLAVLAVGSMWLQRACALSDRAAWYVGTAIDPWVW